MEQFLFQFFFLKFIDHKSMGMYDLSVKDTIFMYTMMYTIFKNFGYSNAKK